MRPAGPPPTIAIRKVLILISVSRGVTRLVRSGRELLIRSLDYTDVDVSAKLRGLEDAHVTFYRILPLTARHSFANPSSILQSQHPIVLSHSQFGIPTKDRLSANAESATSIRSDATSRQDRSMVHIRATASLASAKDRRPRLDAQILAGPRVHRSAIGVDHRHPPRI